MNWKDLKREWSEDAEWSRAFEDEYPFRDVAIAIVGLRARRGLTQAQLAELAGTQQSVISRLESGQHSVEIELLNRIANALGLTWRPQFGLAEEASAQPVLARPDFLTFKGVIVSEPQANPKALFLDQIRVTHSAPFIPSSARSQSTPEFSRRPKTEEGQAGRYGMVAA